MKEAGRDERVSSLNLDKGGKGRGLKAKRRRKRLTAQPGQTAEKRHWNTLGEGKRKNKP